MPFLNPFKKYDVTHFQSQVWVPLSQAPPRHPSVVVENQRRRDSIRWSSLAASEQSKVSANEAPVLEKGSSPSSDSVENGGGRLTIQQLREEIEADIAASGHDSAYDRKSKVVNKAIQDIGMGRYQWELFCLCGFGWLADNLWLQGVALTLPSFTAEYGVSETNVRFTTLSLFLGLCIGASFWGTISDVIGRRPAFNITLLITAIFGTSVGGTSTWIQACALYAAAGVGLGGNLPVDGTLFLEFLPFANGNLLTLLSVWWPFGQLLGSLMAWGFLTNYTCTDASGSPLSSCSSVASGVPCCTKDSNMGWRYLNYTMGAFTFFMFICRYFIFHLFESPKFLLSKGQQREAAAAVYGIAYHNNAKTWLSEDILDEIGGKSEEGEKQGLSTKQVIMRQAGKFSTQRIKPLFSYKRLAINTVLLWFIWTAIGMGYPLFNAFLPQYLSQSGGESKSVSTTYRDYAITSIVGCPGSIIACLTVDIKYLGRKGTMAIATLLTGIFLFLFTQSATESYQLAFSCLVALFQNVMYGVLYAYTPETFPAPNRGTGTGIASCFNRIAGLCAPLIGIYGALNDPKVPIYVSGALMLSAFLAMVGLPIETMGKQTL